MRRAFFGLFLLGSLSLFAVFAYYISIGLPEISDEQAQASHICFEAEETCNGRNSLASASQADSDRETIDSLDEVPTVIIDALVATEDKTFYEHRGVNTTGILRAAFQTVKAKATGSGSLQGGSSITQQLVKNRYIDPTKSDLARKPEEIALAVKLERRLAGDDSIECSPGEAKSVCAKQEILRQYFNTVYYGRGTNGVKSAARIYFDKSLSEINLEEAAYLAGVLRNPTRAAPENNPEEARRRIDVTLQLMLQEEYITESDIEIAEARMAENFVANPALGHPLPNFADKVSREGLGEVELSEFGSEYFVDEVWQQVDELYPGRRFTGGFKVYTTMDPALQQSAWESLAATISPENPELPNTALVSIDGNGMVRAMVGGYDFANKPFNFATARGSAGRQPGSTFKTIGLAAAIENGISVDSLYTAPRTIEIPAGYKGIPMGSTWNVKGGLFADESYPNYTNLEEATWRSTNTVYAQLAFDVGPENIAETAAALGIQGDLSNPEPSFILGTKEVSVLDLASAYSTFERAGRQINPRVIQRIEDSRGRVICWYPANGTCAAENTEVEPQIEGNQAISRETAREVNQVLRGVISSGTGRQASFGRPAAGKTGTSQGSRDAWFSGYTCDLTTAVWVGYDDNRNMEGMGGLFPGKLGSSGSVQGGNLPSMMWSDFMSAATEGAADCPSLDVDSSFSGSVTNADLKTGLQACAVLAPSPTPVPTPIDPGTPTPSTVNPGPDPLTPVPTTGGPIEPVRPTTTIEPEVLPASLPFAQIERELVQPPATSNNNGNNGNSQVNPNQVQQQQLDCMVPGDNVEKRWVKFGDPGAIVDPRGPIITVPPTVTVPSTTVDPSTSSSSSTETTDSTTSTTVDPLPPTTGPPTSPTVPTTGTTVEESTTTTQEEGGPIRPPTTRRGQDQGIF